MQTLKDFLEEQLKDADFRREYEAIQPEMDIIRAMIDDGTLQNFTQKEISEKAKYRCNGK